MRGNLSDEQIHLQGAIRAIAVAGGLSVIGWAGTAFLATGGEHGLQRFYQSFLVNFMFFLSLGLGALFFVLVSHLTRAGWSVALRRIGEAISLTVVPFVVFGIVVYLGRHELYEWTHHEAVATDELLQHKQAYLNANFFLARVVFYFVVWSVLAIYFARRSTQQDRSGDLRATLQMERAAAPGMIFFAMTLTFAVFDFIMSLYPHWYSTIFGVYYFSGGVLGVFSLVTLLVVALQRAGKLSGVVTGEHFHDLGKLMFAFVVFWAYIAFSQFMLIWYAHIPEETEFYLTRQEGPWLEVSLVLLFGHFFVPFLWLMSRHTKRRTVVLATAAVWLLAMHWLDIYYLVMPETSPEHLPFHLLDLTTFLGIGGVFLAVVFWRLERRALVPLGDPRLAESIGFENA